MNDQGLHVTERYRSAISPRTKFLRSTAVYDDQSTQGKRGCRGTLVVTGLFFLLHYQVRR
jgi:hypothetical protein